MNEFVKNMKNIVTVVVMAEFLKGFFINERYKKYIAMCINILIFSFLLSYILKIDFNFDIPFQEFQSDITYENKIEEQYKNDIKKSLMSEYEKENIYVQNIIIETSPQYNVVSLKIYINNESDYEKVKNITDKTGIENYEIIGKPKNDFKK